MIRLALALGFVVLHGVDGQIIIINPEQVTSLRAPKADQSNKLFTEGAHCMVNFTDGKFVTVKERCDAIEVLIERK